MQALISCALLSQVTCIHIVRHTCTHITRHTWVSRWSPMGLRLSGWWCYLGWGPCGWAPSQKFQENIILIKLKLTEKLVEFNLKSLPVDRHKWTTTSNFRMGGSVGPHPFSDSTSDYTTDHGYSGVHRGDIFTGWIWRDGNMYIISVIHQRHFSCQCT